MKRRLRIAILAHSTNPRGGVVHALELGDALCRLGHDATVHAPDAGGRGFFRSALARTVCVAASPVGRSITTMVETRVADYLRHFERAEHRGFDVWHAQDGISANALVTLKERGVISAFARTVHHVDDFADPRLAALQSRAIASADRLFVVSRLWRDFLARAYGREAVLVGNGVDCTRFSPMADATDATLRERLSLAPLPWDRERPARIPLPVLPGSASVPPALPLQPGASCASDAGETPALPGRVGRGWRDARGPRVGPVFLAIGGVEHRKNTIGLLEALRIVHGQYPSSYLIIAGGASLLDHDAYLTRFADVLEASGLPDDALIRTGPLPQALMPALYRAADALVFPSIKEGFGLVILEAMASGIPVVTSRIAPFTEYLGDSDVLWCDPHDAASIAAAMVAALAAPVHGDLIARGLEVAARHDWATAARAHLSTYEALSEAAYA
jgi:glycosyltransferase involved in cell wall biosynthesis